MPALPNDALAAMSEPGTSVSPSDSTEEQNTTVDSDNTASVDAPDTEAEAEAEEEEEEEEPQMEGDALFGADTAIASLVGQHNKAPATQQPEVILNKDLTVGVKVVDEENHLKEWTIDWQSLLSSQSQLVLDLPAILKELNLSLNTNVSEATWESISFTKKDGLFVIEKMQNYYDNKQVLSFIADGMSWNKSNYVGYCEPYFYPLMALTSNLDVGAEYGLQNKGVVANELIDNLFEVDASVYNWYNNSYIRDDMLRKEYFESHESQWRFESVLLNDVKENSEGANTIEVVLSKNMIDYHTHPYDKINTAELTEAKLALDASMLGNRFLCVYSDGTTTVTDEINERNMNYQWIHTVLVIHCPLEDETKRRLFADWYPDVRGEENSNDLKLDQSRVGLTLFSLHPRESKIDLINEIMIAANVQVPICHKVIKNRRPRIYLSEQDYYDIEDEDFSAQQNIYMAPRLISVFADLIGAGSTSLEVVKKLKPKHFLSGVTLIHPSSRDSQSMLMMAQWMDYHLFQGFDHFYIFDHMFGRSENDVTMIYDSLYENYIAKGVVTYLQLFSPLQSHWSFQHCVFVNAAKTVKYETKLLAMNDIDEWFVIYPKNEEAPLTDLPTLRELYEKHIDHFNYHHLYGYRGYPNFDKLSDMIQDHCDNSQSTNRYDTFMQRQTCLVYKMENDNITQTIEELVKQDENPAKMSAKLERVTRFLGYSPSVWWLGFANMPKSVIDPAVVHNGWMHYIAPDNVNKFAPLNPELEDLDDADYDIFLHHLADHVLQFDASKYWTGFDYDKPSDMKLFMTLTASKCDHEDAINYWSKRFLTSDFGSKYLGQHFVNPFMDKDATYCYLKNSHDDSYKSPFDLLAKPPIPGKAQARLGLSPLDDVGLTEWRIKWNVLASQLVGTNFGQSDGGNEVKLMTSWNVHLSSEEAKQQLVSSIVWKNEYFHRECMAGAYVPNYAFLSLDELESIQLKKGALLDPAKAEFDDELHLTDFNLDHYKFWFNTSLYHDDNTRVKHLRKSKVSWRVDGVLPTMIDDRYMVEVMLSMHAPAGYARDQGWSVSAERGMDPNWHHPNFAIDIRNDKALFLCVFSDGTTILTDPRDSIQKTNQGAEQYYEKFINCDITDHPDLVKKVFDFERDGSSQSGPFTNLGLTVFSLRPKLSKFELMSEFLVSMSVELPVCNKFVVNREPQLYQSEKEYYQVDEHTEMHIINYTPNENSKRSRKLVGWTIVHPQSRMNEQDMNLRQWVDWHLMMGFEHFIIYDHHNERNSGDIDYFYKVLKPYIQAKYVTLIEWPVTIHHFEARQYQAGSLMHCIKSFRYDSDYIALTDIDEWIIVEQKDSNALITLKQAITNVEIEANTEFDSLRMKDYRAWGTNLFSILIDPIRANAIDAEANGIDFNYIGCSKYFDTFLERQNCIYSSVDSEDSLRAYNGDPTIRLNQSEIDIIKSLVDTQCGFEILPKQIVNPRSAYSVNQHEFRDLNTLYLEQDDGTTKEPKYLASEKYNIFIVHTADHYRPDRKGFPCYNEYLPNFADPVGALSFINLVNSKCQSQNIILSWNREFKNSKYGQKYNQRKRIKPILDEDGTLCYLKMEFSSQYNPHFAWIDEIN